MRAQVRTTAARSKEGGCRGEARPSGAPTAAVVSCRRAAASPAPPDAAPRGGFTLLELMLSVALLAIAASVTFAAFYTATRAWKRGVALADSLHHGDFVVDQLSLALRSAYYPDTGASGDDYGFLMEDGAGEYAQDKMSWVKLGGALVGHDWPSVGSPHRVIVSVEPDKDGRESVCVRAWRMQGQPEEFDPLRDVDPVFLSRRVHGINCRPAFKLDDGTIEWRDAWEDTNRIPLAVEVTLYVDPTDEGEPPVEVKRVVAIPVAFRSWEIRRTTPGTPGGTVPGGRTAPGRGGWTAPGHGSSPTSNAAGRGGSFGLGRGQVRPVPGK